MVNNARSTVDTKRHLINEFLISSIGRALIRKGILTVEDIRYEIQEKKSETSIELISPSDLEDVVAKAFYAISRWEEKR